MIVDVHAHVIVPEITRDAQPGEAWRPRVYRDDDGAPVVELGGREIRAAIAEFVDIDGILAAQAEAGADRVLLSPWVPLLYYDAEPGEGLARTRLQNDALAGLVREGRLRRAGRSGRGGGRRMRTRAHVLRRTEWRHPSGLRRSGCRTMVGTSSRRMRGWRARLAGYEAPPRSPPGRNHRPEMPERR